MILFTYYLSKTNNDFSTREPVDGTQLCFMDRVKILDFANMHLTSVNTFFPRSLVIKVIEVILFPEIFNPLVNT